MNLQIRDTTIDNVAPLVDDPALLKKIIEAVNNLQAENPEVKVLGYSYKIEDQKLEFTLEVEPGLSIPDIHIK